jgi:hypothetical protein
MFTALDRIRAARAAPLTHRVTTTFADGTERTHDTRSAASAGLWAVGERQNLGRDLISRNADLTDGPIVRVISVAVTEIAADQRIAA